METIPDSLIDNMIEMRNFQSGNNLLQQIFYGMIDLTFHDGFNLNDNLNTTDVIKKLQNKITNYPYVEGTYQEASFDHLLDYSASYYGYLWSEVYAHDIFSVFEKEGILNSDVGYRFRKEILEKGGSEDPMELVINFLGRIPNNKAFLERYGVEN